MENKRLYYIDWLRVLAFGLLFIFHAVRFFDSYPWHVKNIESSVWADHFVLFTHTWRMPLIFLISGTGTYFALRSRKRRFLRDRIQRLVIPFVFGIIVLIPPQKYLEAIHHSVFEGTFWSFMKIYPSGVFDANIGINLIWTGHLGYHIWYLAYLFVQTLVFLPLFKYLAGIQNKISSIKPNLIHLSALILPFVLIEFLLRPLFPSYLDWADFGLYSLYFFYGFLFHIHKDFIRIIERYGYLFLSVGIICWITYVCNREMLDQISYPQYSVQYLFSLLLKNVNSFAWVISILAMGKKFLNLSHSLLPGLNRGILPFYILHQTVLIMIGYYVIQWDLTITEKFILILTVSFIATVGMYQIIRRMKYLRPLFGMGK